MNYNLTSSLLNRLRFIFDSDLRISNVTERIAAAYGDADAFVSEQPLEYLGIRTPALTFQEIHSIVGRLATLLIRAGLVRFERVAIYKSNSIDYFLMALAVMRAGGIAVPVNGKLSPASFKRYAEYTGCVIVYTDAETLRTLAGHLPCGVRTWILPSVAVSVATLVTNCLLLDKALSNDVPIAPPAKINRSDDALIVHTSGTTGFPKGVLHSSESLIYSTRLALIRSLVPIPQRGLMAAHQNHHITFCLMLVSCMAGAWSYVATDHSPNHLFAVLAQEKITLFFAFPDIYLALCLADLKRHSLPEIRTWFTGGDAMHEAHIRQFVEKGERLRIFGVPFRGSLFIEWLGTSEVGTVALLKISTVRTQRYSRYIGKQSWIGPKVKVANEFGEPVAADTAGRLMVCGPTLFKGYWNSHERLHHVFIDGWWWTGDVARKDRRGRIYHLDREVDVVHTHKGMVFGLPIEEELLKCEDIGEAAVIGLDRVPNDLVAVAVVHSMSGRPVDIDGVLRQINGRLPTDQQLTTIIDIGDSSAIPRGLTGKVLKRELRDRLAGRLSKTSKSISAARQMQES